MKLVIFLAVTILSVGALASSIIFRQDSDLPAHVQKYVEKAVLEACPAIEKNGWTVREIGSMEDGYDTYSSFKTSLYVYASDSDGYHPDEFYLTVTTEALYDNAKTVRVVSVKGGQRQCAR